MQSSSHKLLWGSIAIATINLLLHSWTAAAATASWLAMAVAYGWITRQGAPRFAQLKNIRAVFITLAALWVFLVAITAVEMYHRRDNAPQTTNDQRLNRPRPVEPSRRI